MSYYAFRRKSVKWWKKLFFHFFDLALVNAHILHKKQATEKYRLYIFIQRVAEGLVADVGKEARIQSPPGTGGRLLGRDHFPYRIWGSGKKKEGWAQRLCKVCSDRGKHESESLHVNTQPCTVRNVMLDSASESVLSHITLWQTTGAKLSPSVLYFVNVCVIHLCM